MPCTKPTHFWRYCPWFNNLGKCQLCTKPLWCSLECSCKHLLQIPCMPTPDSSSLCVSPEKPTEKWTMDLVCKQQRGRVAKHTARPYSRLLIGQFIICKLGVQVPDMCGYRKYWINARPIHSRLFKVNNNRVIYINWCYVNILPTSLTMFWCQISTHSPGADKVLCHFYTGDPLILE